MGQRLTYKDKWGRWDIGKFENIPAAIDRLAAYEDTGLSPKGFSELHSQLEELEAYNACFPLERAQELAEAESAFVVGVKWVHNKSFTVSAVCFSEEAAREHIRKQMEGKRPSGLGYWTFERAELDFATCAEAEAATQQRGDGDE